MNAFANIVHGRKVMHINACMVSRNIFKMTMTKEMFSLPWCTVLVNDHRDDSQDLMCRKRQ